MLRECCIVSRVMRARVLLDAQHRSIAANAALALPRLLTTDSASLENQKLFCTSLNFSAAIPEPIQNPIYSWHSQIYPRPEFTDHS